MNTQSSEPVSNRLAAETESATIAWMFRGLPLADTGRDESTQYRCLFLPPLHYEPSPNEARRSW